RAFARLRFESPAVLTRGDRFILRAYSPPVTIAGGSILDPQPPRSVIRSARALERYRRLETDGAHGDRSELNAIALMVEEPGPPGLGIGTLAPRAGLPPDALDRAVAALVDSGAAMRIGDVLLTAAAFDTLRKSIARLVARHHDEQPLSPGIPREELRTRLFSG